MNLLYTSVFFFARSIISRILNDSTSNSREVKFAKELNVRWQCPRILGLFAGKKFEVYSSRRIVQ